MDKKTLELVEKIKKAKRAERNGIRIKEIEVIKLEMPQGTNRRYSERIKIELENGKTLLLTEAKFWDGEYTIKA